MSRLTRAQSRALTRHRLLAAAGDVVGRDGYDAASVARIADAAGYSKGAFYSNFASKEDVVLHLLEDHTHSDLEDLARLLEQIDDPDEVIEALVHWSGRVRAEPNWGVIAIEYLRRAERDGTLTDRQRDIFVGPWSRVGRLVLARLRPDVDPADLAVDVGGTVLELAYGGVCGFLKPDAASRMLRLVLTGIRRAPR